MDLSFYKGKKVFITGHTGFKGSWLLMLLHQAGAEVYGFSLAPRTQMDHFIQIEGEKLCKKSIIGDINDYEKLEKEILNFEPDVIFHLAAQALVKDSYDDPVLTYKTNIMGTVHILDIIRKLPNKCAVVLITTDKVYQNPEDGRHFKEEDKLGGYDPYSASKACDEIIISSYRNSFFNNDKYDNHLKSICSMRAGNVIGGGDFSPNRIIPDIVNSITNGKAVLIRNPNAIRPWQHVIEPIYAYAITAIKMWQQPLDYNTSYNIGPYELDMLKVIDIAQKFIEISGKGSFEIEKNHNHPHEAALLFLNNEKLEKEIGFKPKLSAEKAIKWTADWYADAETPAFEKTKKQINDYLNL